MEAIQAGDLMTARDWQATRGSHLFQTFLSFEWFMRQHREQLIKQGALIPQRGSRPSLVTPRMDTIIPEILIEQANSAA